MKELIGAITVVLSLVATVPYIVDIVRKKTKPHVFTWVVWALITFIAFLAQWKSGGGAGSWATGVTGIITIFIAFLSVVYGTKDIKKMDLFVFAGALAAIIPWLLTKDPTLSVIFLTLINSLAFIPTIRKTMIDPGSETLSSYVIHAMRHGLSLLALANYNISTFLYPLITGLMNILVIWAITRAKIRKN